MIKRRFYKLEHGQGDAPSDSSSSSSDSEIEAAAEEDEQSEEQEILEDEDDYDDEEEEDDDDDDDVDKNEAIAEMLKKNLTGYKSEDSSENGADLDSPGSPTRDVDESENSHHKTMTEGYIPYENSTYILKYKSVFKCRICPKVILLSEKFLNAHLESKKHARSEKQLKEGKLKLMLSDDGRIEGQEDDDSSRKKEKKVRKRKEKKSFEGKGRGKRSQKKKEFGREKNRFKRRRNDDV